MSPRRRTTTPTELDLTINVPVSRATKKQLLVAILAGQSRLEERMSNLDNAVENVTTQITRVAEMVTGELVALREKLATAQADDAAAADVAADVEENVAKLEEQANVLRSIGSTETPPVDPADETPVDPAPAPVDPTA